MTSTDEHESSSESPDDSSGDSSSEDESLDEEEVLPETEEDFERLVGNIKGTEDITNTSILSKIWDNPQSEQEYQAQFHNDLRAASGIGRRKVKSQGRRAGGPPLSHELRQLLGEGNAAYVDGDLPRAIEFMTEAVRIEPRVVSAYNVLSMAYRELKDDTRYLHFAIIGAHLRKDPDVWRELAHRSVELGAKGQAEYCIGKAAALAPDDVEVLSERVRIAREVGNSQAVKAAYLGLLRLLPHDVVILTGLRHILIEQGDLNLCAELYQKAFEHYATTFRDGQVRLEQTTSTIDPRLAAEAGSTFGLMELLVLADTYDSLGAYEKAIKVIRSGSRWLQGRADQTYWDTCLDDREFDPPDLTREDFSGGMVGIRMRQGFHPLDVNARQRLAIARLKLGDIDEGRLHSSVVLNEDITEFWHLFVEIADAFFEKGLFADARTIYETLGADASTSSMHILMQVADCRLNMGETKEAEELYDHIVKLDPSNADAKKRLAEIYETSGQLRKALDLLMSVIDLRKRPGDPADGDSNLESPVSATPSASLLAERKRGRPRKEATVKRAPAMSMAERVEREARKEKECAVYWAACERSREGMRRGVKEDEGRWCMNAESLLEMFRETRMLFPAASSKGFRGMIASKTRRSFIDVRNEEHIVSRLRDAIASEREEREARKGGVSTFDKEVVVFRGKHFDEWLGLALDYAFLMSRKGNIDSADDLLRHLTFSIVYQKQRYQDTIRLSLATCAIRNRRYDIVLEMFRKLFLVHQFNNEPHRLFLASLASGLPQAEQFVSTNLQKFMLRELRTHNAAVDGSVHWVPQMRRWTMIGGEKEGEKGDEDDEGNLGENGDGEMKSRPTVRNAMLPLIYGQSLAVAKSFQSSIFYLLHAYDYYPDDPVLCMTLAIASLGRAMQRQADNRNYLVVQGMGFMERYRKLRQAGEHGAYEDEIEYNFGRAFHHLGLLTYAVKHYEAALRHVEKRKEMDDNYVGVSREAAYNLSLVFITTGATPLADEILAKWLSV